MNLKTISVLLSLLFISKIFAVNEYIIKDIRSDINSEFYQNAATILNMENALNIENLSNSVMNSIYIPQFEFRYNYNLLEAYRVDTRSPEEIAQIGFSGTISENHLISTFGNKNVFSAADIESAKRFYESAKAQSPGKQYFLYRIDTEGLRTLSFEDNMAFDQTGFIERLTDENIKLNYENYSRTKRFQRDPNMFHSYISDKIKAAITEAFLPAREIHIEGPIQPSRIFFIEKL
ncbi:hypothetical protein ACWNT8_02490 [Pigmentibacter ruber]